MNDEELKKRLDKLEACIDASVYALGILIVILTILLSLQIAFK